ncbi:MAG: sugar transferase [Actinomycetia bacterium]|nr:sugar transferase [Actinomycetes bacterium]
MTAIDAPSPDDNVLGPGQFGAASQLNPYTADGWAAGGSGWSAAGSEWSVPADEWAIRPRSAAEDAPAVTIELPILRIPTEDLFIPSPREAADELPPGGRIRSNADRWESRYVTKVVVADVIVGLVAGFAAFAARFSHLNDLTGPYLLASLLMPLAWALVLLGNRAYERRFLFVGNEEYRRVLNSGIALTAGVAVASYTANAEVARGYVLIALPLVTALGLAGRYALRVQLFAARKRGRCMRRVVVLGYERPVASLCRQLSRERYHGMEVVGACLPPGRPAAGGQTALSVPVYGTFDDIAAAVRAAVADTVAVLPCPEMDSAALRRLSWELERTGTDLVVASALLDVAGPRTSIRPVDGLPMLHVDRAELTGGRRVVKATFDRVVGSALLFFLAPVLAGLALAVKLGSKGPAVFAQTRVGKDGREFTLYKLRTMYTDAEQRLAELSGLNEHDGLMFKMRNDPRVTPAGRWLRRFSLDELPQLVNVVLGQMSLVGPRPPLPTEVAQYHSDVYRRLAVKPGLTGLWQVSGRSDLSWEDTVRLDLRYVENWSLTFDLVILLRTVTAIVRSSGAY